MSTQTVDWRAQAACGPRPGQIVSDTAALFFPKETSGYLGRERERDAKAICRTCPVLSPCREWALREQDHGIAGGLNADERRRARGTVPGRKMPFRAAPGRAGGRR